MPTVAQAVAQTLAAYDTEYYFCLTGGDHDLWIALREAGIRIINCRSESAATYMADGYARVSGRPGFVYGQRGPGAANVAAALADALWGSSPVVSLTTSIALQTRDRFQYQDVDTLPMHAPVTIWNRSLAAESRTAALVRAAIRAATAPVPGPVHLEIPADMLQRPAGTDIYAEPAAGVVGGRRVHPDPAELERLRDRLLAARRPLIVAGTGVMLSEAWAELGRLSAALGIPVATTLGGKGAIDEAEDLAVGVIGRYSRRVANETVRAADLILAIGTRLGGLATHAWSLPFDRTELLQIDCDPYTIGHTFPVGVGVVADAKLALQRLLEGVPNDPSGECRSAWARDTAERVVRWREHAQALERRRPADGIHPATVLAALRGVMAPDDLLAADTGAIAAWAGTLFPVPAGRAMIRSAGSLGWVVPGALGAALAAPHRRTVALTGDGGLLYHIGELETAVRCDIPVVVVVLNNLSFASEYHLLKHIWHADVPEVVDFHDVDFAAVANGFGVAGIRVDRPEDLETALTEAMNLRAPALVDVRVSKEAEAPNEGFRGDDPV